MKEPQDLEDVLASDTADEVDSGCAATFEILHRYVDAELAGKDPGATHPGAEAHLRRCPACREDYLGLIESVREFGDALPADG